MSEALSWILIAGAVITFMHSQKSQSKASVIMSPNTQNEVDLSRWRHDGEQPLYYKDGNQAAFVDEQVKNLVLAF